MESLFLINPRRKRRRNPMPAGLKRYWAKHRSRRKNPRASKRRRRRNPLAALANPRRKRRRNPRVQAYTHRKRRRNPIARHHRRARHRNPFSVGGVKSVLVPAAIGAGGAIALQIAYGYISPKLPTTMSRASAGT